MLTTRLCELLGIQHPVVLGGMGTATNAELVAAVSNAGGFGILGTSSFDAAGQLRETERIRSLTALPFGINHLLCFVTEDRYAATLASRPQVVSTAWAWPEQDLHDYFTRAHDVGSIVMHMVSTVEEARRAAEAGADIVVAQGTEGGGHVGVMGTMPLVPMVVRSVAPLPVLAAGGVADGAGLAAALALGAEGVLLGTRFLATPEAPVPESYKRRIVESDGHDTFLTDIPDLVSGRVWPGALLRVTRNRFIERWAGREWEVRKRRAEIAASMRIAREADDGDEYSVAMGQTSGLISDIVPAGQLVGRIVAEAEAILLRQHSRLTPDTATPASS